MSDYAVKHLAEVPDEYADTASPGEWRSLSEAVHAEQVVVTLIVIPPRTDQQEGTGHRHRKTEELYIVAAGHPKMKLDDEIVQLEPGTTVRVAPQTARTYRNDADDEARILAISVAGSSDAEKIEDFWPDGAQRWTT